MKKMFRLFGINAAGAADMYLKQMIASSPCVSAVYSELFSSSALLAQNRK
ncbi:MAG: hypothetical protein HUK08_04220 [Bacteroidaceae bacterium]|nr:hypothetical protein [Bacteroidaceae bacterium]